MNEHQSPRGAYFDGRFPPDPTTFTGTLMTRVAGAVDTREALVAGFAAVAAQMPTYFPAEQPMGAAQVARLVDAVIGDHNEQVLGPSSDAIRVLDMLDAFPAAGLAVVFGEGSDDAGALQALTARAERVIELGGHVDGYVYATANDLAELVLHGRLPLTYGIYAESDLTLAQASACVLGVLDQHALPLLEHSPDEQRVVIGPIVYQVPYHGHRLHELPEPEPGD